MSTDYPGAIDSWAAVTDNVDDVLAVHVNRLSSAANAIESELGTSPSGSFGTVKLALAQSAGEKASAKGDLFIASAANAVGVLGVGSDGQALVADSGEALGLKWGDAVLHSEFDAKGDLLLGTGSDAFTRLAVGSDHQKLIADAGEASGAKWADDEGVIALILDGGGDVLTTGAKINIPELPDLEFTSVRLMSIDGDGNAVTGSIVVDVRVDDWPNFPDSGDSICASAKPTLSSESDSEDTTLTGWTVAHTGGRVAVLYVESVSTCQLVGMSLGYKKRVP